MRGRPIKRTLRAAVFNLFITVIICVTAHACQLYDMGLICLTYVSHIRDDADPHTETASLRFLFGLRWWES